MNSLKLQASFLFSFQDEDEHHIADSSTSSLHSNGTIGNGTSLASGIRHRPMDSSEKHWHENGHTNGHASSQCSAVRTGTASGHVTSQQKDKPKAKSDGDESSEHIKVLSRERTDDILTQW